MEDVRVLTVTCFGDAPEENDRVTFNPMVIKFIRAKDDIKQGRPVKKVTVYMDECIMEEFFMSEYDLLTLEAAIGGYLPPTY